LGKILQRIQSEIQSSDSEEAKEDDEIRSVSQMRKKLGKGGD